MNARTFFLFGLLCALTLSSAWTFTQAKRAPKPKPAVKIISFSKDVAPVLKKYCLPCHTEDMMNPSELYLDTYANIIAGGKHGRMFIAGAPDSSLLMQKIAVKPPFGDRMPLKLKTPFPDDTLKILSRWILQGAKNN